MGSVASQGGGLGNRIAIWRSRPGKAATGFVSQPEPRSIGLYGRGKQLLAGNLQFAGHLIQNPDRSIWQVTPPDAAFAQALHSFAWLDDLAAVGDATARRRAQDWAQDWIAAHGRGGGPGWSPDLTGGRLIRWVNHAPFLLAGRSRDQMAGFFASASHQLRYLARRWPHATPGLARFEALAGLIVAGLALQGLGHLSARALPALARDCQRLVDGQGGIPTRNPEQLLEVLTLLNWASLALREAGQTVPLQLASAMARIVPTLRALRHADGGLARFHGGGRGLDGRLEAVLAETGLRAPLPGGLAMGFARLAAGRTTVIVDCAPPPTGPAGKMGHASTLGFELTSGRRPVIVNCGSGAAYGADWHRASRATASHSTLALDGYSSSRFGPGGGEVLTELAPVLGLTQTQEGHGLHLSVAHGGWARSHGLTHGRLLSLDLQGRRLTGTDLIEARSVEDLQRIEALIAAGVDLPFALRFHLHPDVEAGLDLGGTAVSLTLKSGEVWVFRHDGRAALTLDASVYLEEGRLQPRPAQQIVLSGQVIQPRMRIGWTLAKAQDTPLAIRDLDREELPVPI